MSLESKGFRGALAAAELMQDSARRYLYLSPWGRGSSASEGTGRMLRPGLTYPLPAGAFLLKARKRVYALTPVRPRFREKPAVIGGLVKPTTRSQA